MEVVAYDAYIKEEAFASRGVEKVTLKEVYGQADIISVHVPLTDETRGMIDEDAIASMKDGIYIVNVARGGIIVEEDLAKAVKDGKLGGAALDVLEDEPPSQEHPLLGLVDKNIVITPHTAWNTREAENKADDHLGDQLKSISDGRVPPSVLNEGVLLHPRVTKWCR